MIILRCWCLAPKHSCPEEYPVLSSQLMSFAFVWNKPHSHIQAWCRSQASWFWQECTSALCQEELINMNVPLLFPTHCLYFLFLPLLVWFICKASLMFPPTAMPSVLVCLGFHHLCYQDVAMHGHCVSGTTLIIFCSQQHGSHFR